MPILAYSYHPMDFVPRPAASPVEVPVLGPCLAMELAWAVRAATSGEVRARHGVLDRLYRDQPELLVAFASLWSDGLEGAPELLVAADHADALEVRSYPVLRSALEGAIDDMPCDQELASERAEDRVAVRSRLADLARSRSRRRIYLELLGDVWNGLGQWWSEEGTGLAHAASAAAARVLAAGGAWTDVVARSALLPGGSAAGGPAASPVAAGASELVRQTSLPVVLVPGVLGGASTYLQLPRFVMVGFDASAGGPRATVGEALAPDELARRLRALADPTRLSILVLLASGPRSVGELTARCNVSQPTVSGHVKLLREAGFVRGRRRSGRVDLDLDRSAVDSLVAQLGGAFGGALGREGHLGGALSGSIAASPRGGPADG